MTLNVRRSIAMSSQHKELVGFHELKSLNFWKAVAAELLVSTIYIILVCGTGLGPEKPSNLHISLTVAFTVAVLASAFWDISGGHFNPAVSLALLFSGKISITRFFIYVVVQCGGSIGGAAVLYAFTPKSFRGELGALALHKDLSVGVGFLIEVVLTFQLIWTVVASTDPIKKFTGFQAPLAIGLSVGIGLMMGIPYTGAALNPIRALGPAVIMDKHDNQWVYWAGPMVGAALAVISYNHVFKLREQPEDEFRSEIELTSVIVNKNNNSEKQQ